MTAEKTRTFEDPESVNFLRDAGGNIKCYTVRETVDDDAEIFKADEWKVSLTFTERPKQRKVGDKVKLPHWADPCVIDAISETSENGPEYWVRYPDGDHCTWLASQFDA